MEEFSCCKVAPSWCFLHWAKLFYLDFYFPLLLRLLFPFFLFHFFFQFFSILSRSHFGFLPIFLFFKWASKCIFRHTNKPLFYGKEWSCTKSSWKLKKPRAGISFLSGMEINFFLVAKEKTILPFNQTRSSRVFKLWANCYFIIF